MYFRSLQHFFFYDFNLVDSDCVFNLVHNLLSELSILFLISSAASRAIVSHYPQPLVFFPTIPETSVVPLMAFLLYFC